MQAIIYTFGAGGAAGGDGNTQILQPWIPTGTADGFDSATLRVDYKGDGGGLNAAYPRGAKASDGSAMYVSGIQIERVSPGWTAASIYARGFWSGTPPILGALSATSFEKDWPFQEGGVEWFLPGSAAGKTGDFNSQTTRRWRIRQILQKGRLERQGAIILDSNAVDDWPGPPAPTASRPNKMSPSQQGLKDPLLYTRTGWNPMGLNPTITAVLGGVTLLTWRDSWEWYDRENA